MSNQASIVPKPAKSHYTEQEAAQELGLSIEQFRKLIRSHIVDTEEDLNNAAIASFHPSDLLVLKILSSLKPSSTLPR